MKIIYVAVLAILVSFSAFVFSKEHGHRNISPEQKVEHMTSRLELDDAQQEQILEILASTQEQRESIQQQMHELREQTHDRITEVLNAEQLAEFEKPRRGKRGNCKPTETAQ